MSIEVYFKDRLYKTPFQKMLHNFCERYGIEIAKILGIIGKTTADVARKCYKGIIPGNFENRYQRSLDTLKNATLNWDFYRTSTLAQGKLSYLVNGKYYDETNIIGDIGYLVGVAGLVQNLFSGEIYSKIDLSKNLQPVPMYKCIDKTFLPTECAWCIPRVKRRECCKEYGKRKECSKCPNHSTPDALLWNWEVHPFGIPESKSALWICEFKSHSKISSKSLFTLGRGDLKKVCEYTSKNRSQKSLTSQCVILGNIYLAPIGDSYFAELRQLFPNCVFTDRALFSRDCKYPDLIKGTVSLEAESIEQSFSNTHSVRRLRSLLRHVKNTSKCYNWIDKFLLQFIWVEGKEVYALYLTYDPPQTQRYIQQKHTLIHIQLKGRLRIRRGHLIRLRKRRPLYPELLNTQGPYRHYKQFHTKNLLIGDHSCQ